MFDETRRFIQAVLCLLLGVALLILWGWTRSAAGYAMLIGAAGAFIAFAVLLWMTALGAYDSHIMTCENYASTFGKLDEEARAAMGFLFPKMHYSMKRGIVREFFEDTEISIDTFR